MFQYNSLITHIFQHNIWLKCFTLESCWKCQQLSIFTHDFSLKQENETAWKNFTLVLAASLLLY